MAKKHKKKKKQLSERKKKEKRDNKIKHMIKKKTGVVASVFFILSVLADYVDVWKIGIIFVTYGILIFEFWSSGKEDMIISKIPENSYFYEIITSCTVISIFYFPLTNIDGYLTLKYCLLFIFTIFICGVVFYERIKNGSTWLLNEQILLNKISVISAIFYLLNLLRNIFAPWIDISQLIVVVAYIILIYEFNLYKKPDKFISQITNQKILDNVVDCITTLSVLLFPLSNFKMNVFIVDLAVFVMLIGFMYWSFFKRKDRKCNISKSR